MLNCEISLPGIEPYPAAPTPAVSKTRVKLQGAVHQPDRRFDVLAKITQNVAGMGEYPRVVARDAKGLPSEVDRLTPVVSLDSVQPPTSSWRWHHADKARAGP